MANGILVIDKPQGVTSHDVVGMARKALHTKRVGHTGTLDPLATGVLVLCIGEATKLVQYLTCDEKIYDVEMKLGIKTDTGDITGNIIENKNIDTINKNVILENIKSFICKQKQLPPMYSAIKKDGVKLYELARQGIEIERDYRDIEIFDISNVSIDGEIIKFRVHCSKGTYVRVLCENIAEKLGNVGTMTSLRRIKSGKFSIDESVNANEISEDKIIDLEKVYNEKFSVDNDLKKIINGMNVKCNLNDGLCNLYYKNTFIGIGEVNKGILKRKIILSDIVETLENL